MEQRSAEQVSRVLLQRENVPCFDGSNSEEEIDAIEDTDSGLIISDIKTENIKIEIKDEPETTEERQSQEFVYGRVKNEWCLTALETQGHKSNIVILPRAIGLAASARTPLQFWSTLFTQDILDIILKYTNAEIERYLARKNIKNCASSRIVSMNELKAFIGILYLCGVQNNNEVNLSEIWSCEFGSTFCKVTMSERRFEFISLRLRFDDKITRAVRRTEDLFAPIREIWDIFILNCQKNYSPSQSVTIDEQLFGFRGHFPARVYIKSKPEQYGIKIVSMNDAKTYYMYNAIPYTGRVTTEQDEDVPSYYARKLSEPIQNTGRNIVEYYDKNKCEKDVFDQLCSNYTCARVCKRWPMRFFLGMLDQASVNSCILYNFIPGNGNKDRRMFLKDLALSLVKPHLEDRAKQPSLHKLLATNIKYFLSPENIQNPILGTDKLQIRKRCNICIGHRDKAKKTLFCCVKCQEPVCDDHRVVCCADCI